MSINNCPNDYDGDSFNGEEGSHEKWLFESLETEKQNGLNTTLTDIQPKALQSNGHPRVVSEKTKGIYSDHIKALRKKMHESNPIEFERRVETPIDLVDFLLSRAHTLRPNTFSSYRSALIYWLNQQTQCPEVHQAMQALDANSPRNGFKGVKPGETATLYSTRSQRKRTFKQKDFQKFIEELNARSSQCNRRRAAIASSLMFWLQAGLATGLRPIEWEKAHWHDKSKGVLFVYTAKAKHDASPILGSDYAYDPAQKTRLVNVDEDSIFCVDQHLLRVRMHMLQGQPFETYYNNVRTYLWNLNRKVFGRNMFTLYMMRGQFAANMKGSGLKSDEVGELMGCSPSVTRSNYGKCTAAHRNGSQHPTPSSYKTVKPKGDAGRDKHT